MKHKLILFLFVCFWFSEIGIASEARQDSDSIIRKAKAANRLWEYDRDSYIELTKLSDEEVKELKKIIADVEEKGVEKGISLLLSLNCMDQVSSSPYYKLYMYRCKGVPFHNFVSDGIKNPYSFAFTKTDNQEAVINYLKEYQMFLKDQVVKNKFPVPTDSIEIISEIISFLEQGGYP